MRIGSKVHPRNGKARRVTVHGKEYVFVPVQDKNDETHFVAEVTNEQHAETLLSNDWFYAYGKELVKPPALTRGGASTSEAGQTSAQLAASAMSDFNAGSSGEQNGATSTLPGPSKHTPEDIAAATELLKGSISDAGKAVGNHTLAVVRAAIDVENAAQAPRKGMVTLLQATLDGAVAAGVTD